ncbi:MAG: Septum formation initiator [Clostridia bacterium]|jgi:cell division protein DivIC|nr:Septum formation initiator [Clostridia bacterium]
MKKVKKIILHITFIITGIIIMVLSVQGYQLSKLIKRVDNQIIIDKKELAAGKKELEKLENEVTQINTPEYIEKVAREELGMVKEEDIVFREKQ